MTTAPAVGGITCPTCYQARPSGRYCAPLRCYCGHPDCPAYASYVDVRALPLPPLPDTVPKKPRGKKSTWDQREEPTWIDQV